MNIIKTSEYYRQLTDDDICDCAFCQNYVKEIRSAYAELAAYLDGLGVDIEKPFEAMPVEAENGIMFYCGVQYVVMGTADDFIETAIGDVRVFIAESHPMTDIGEDHFVIEIAPVYLNWNGEK